MGGGMALVPDVAPWGHACGILCQTNMKRIAVYPGSFDPITNGHLDVIERAARLFDEVIVALARNVEKRALFSVTDRKRMIAHAVGHLRNVRVGEFDGLLVSYARQERAISIIRGLRAVSDFGYEFQMALMNRRLEASIETIFVVPKDAYTFLSSRLIKEIVQLGGDVHGLVPSYVEKLLKKKLRGRHADLS